MDIAAVALVTLVAGLALGWLSARYRGQRRLAFAEAEVARLDAALRVERATADERAALAARTDTALRETFGALSAEALQRNNEAFVALAEGRLGMARAAADGDLAQRQQAIDSVVGPLRESLDAMQQQLRTVERDRAGSYSALLEQISTMRQTSEQLRTETAQLVTALRAPQIRGRWGELQLERAVEAAGLTEHIDYVTQVTAPGEDGVVRP
jgi:DNA recombination protein RmuC